MLLEYCPLLRNIICHAVPCYVFFVSFLTDTVPSVPQNYTVLPFKIFLKILCLSKIVVYKGRLHIFADSFLLRNT